MITAIFLLIFIVFVILGIPIAFALGCSSLIVFLATGLPTGLISHRMYMGLDKFALLAIPFFIFSGELMGSSGILHRLMDFSRLIVGRIRGGLLQVNIVVSMLFGGINGAAVADTSAVGSMIIPMTIKEYNDPPVIAAVTACSSVVGPLIPPSLPLLIYALAAQNVSIGGLFIAGIIPGILLGVGMMVVVYFTAKRKNYPLDSTVYTFKDVVSILKHFFIAIPLPLIIVGGIVSGIFTPTEAGCIAVLYALVIGFFVTKELTWSKVYVGMLRTISLTAAVFIIISMANVSTYWLSIQMFPVLAGNFITSLTSTPEVFLLLLIFLLIIIGCFIEGSAAIIMLVPVIVPIAEGFGIPSLQLGMVTCLAIFIGLITPPVGLCLFIASNIAECSLESVFKASLSFLILEFGVLLLITFFPEVFLWLPRYFGFQIS